MDPSAEIGQGGIETLYVNSQQIGITKICQVYICHSCDGGIGYNAIFNTFYLSLLVLIDSLCFCELKFLLRICRT